MIKKWEGLHPCVAKEMKVSTFVKGALCGSD